MGAKHHYGECRFWKYTYGFIKEEGNHTQHYVHYTQIRDMDGYAFLVPGDRVRFEVGRGENGNIQALNVFLLERED